MKIAILSMQRVINFGSVLQAYSLAKMIEEITGIQPEFIDIDDIQTIPCDISVKGDADYKVEADLPPGILQKIKRRFFWKLSKLNDKKIKEFTKMVLHLDDNTESYYDYVVIGSDEVFNLTSGLRLQLFGNVNQARQVISYAASCGTAVYEDIPKKNLEQVKSALKNFKAMSVRDFGTKEFIGRLYDGKIEMNLDPVLMGNLYTRNHKKVFIKDYILVYAYGNRIRTKEEIEAIQKFAKKKNLKTVAIGGVQFWCDLYIPASPFRVLDYFYYANYIVTDTFHGTIFSVINHKKFVTIVRKTNTNKIESLLKNLHLDSRLVSDIHKLEKVMINDIDYKSVDQYLEKKRIEAYDYLKRNWVEIN